LAAFAEVVKELWKEGDLPVSLQGFMTEVDKYAEQFKPSADLALFWLLDALHEDLNRVLRKPYIEHVDDPKLTDEEAAAKRHREYMMRNDSIINDLVKHALFFFFSSQLP